MSPPYPIDTYLFDIGNVLIRWTPEVLLHDLFGGDGTAVRDFSAAIDLPGLILDQDRGLTVAEAEARVAARAPEHLESFRTYERRWIETIAGEIPETVAFLRALRTAGRPVYALSNYAADHMVWSEPHYPILTEFDGRVISAHEGVIKPEPTIYQIVIERFGITPARTLFIDDRAENVAAARALGFRAHCFDTDRPRALAEALPAPDAALFHAAIEDAGMREGPVE
ncbi:HAD family phosphatase [Marivibrio halodurans]|uniref:HAD family phosphatase n=1 Tax=Marivibrio halodurans TaxID=2039722 RepID=A0A8J7RZD5_9PROT|nr:HAD family phosphatase [Marivibrio halodurans]MBP5857360.1 HAD family phosphatase [Marivibrio halodurans]